MVIKKEEYEALLNYLHELEKENLQIKNYNDKWVDKYNEATSEKKRLEKVYRNVINHLRELNEHKELANYMEAQIDPLVAWEVQ